ncbi:MAG TPA: hypothetical protein VHW09_09435 [Bryobacteraceae bacterium]|nr:hypothetical protein [Bryobacteraceae bacterium]
MVYIVFSYSFMALIAFQVGPSAPPLHAMLIDVGLAFLSQAALLAAPFIVWRSNFGRNRQPLAFGAPPAIGPFPAIPSTDGGE